MKIIANSLPKSGTHLLVNILELLDFKDSKIHFSASMVRRNSRFFVKNILISRRLDDAGIRLDIDNPSLKINKDWFNRLLDSVNYNSFSEGHLPWSAELVSALHKKGFKIIHITRDPRDVALSHMNHVGKFKNYPLNKKFRTLNQTQKLCQILYGVKNGETYIISPLKNRIEESLGWINQENICSVKFEDIIGEQGGGSIENQRASLRKITDYLAIDISNRKLNEIAANIYSPNAETFHKGKIGLWQSVFTDAEKELLLESVGSFLERGAEFDR
ncbi:sulfotransferase domain-containing protein [Ketobacter sp. MCCC 1A13808]|uniref:sulfotransferase domain-containing protein n=1 Tax=Ketobacter sp. MCCC 1A13808 TaxID=2602738 RepID=UPI0012ECA83A|nr:sulfotransferase domain-containing protein [Ketobacter sp. MCCC 1A13808]MVF12931.1 sulfotransferase domain-containing protein [Ketobacter sp. MCCC 1A13808]